VTLQSKVEHCHGDVLRAVLKTHIAMVTVSKDGPCCRGNGNFLLDDRIQPIVNRLEIVKKKLETRQVE